MKIIEKGPGWSLEQICTGKGNGNGGCGSKLLIERNDIYITSSTDYSGDTDYFYTFKCPVCNVETDIAESKIPASIKREAMEKERNAYVRTR